MGETEQVEEKQDNKMTTGKEKISRTEYNRNRALLYDKRRERDTGGQPQRMHQS